VGNSGPNVDTDAFCGSIHLKTAKPCAAPQQCKPGERKQADCNTCSCNKGGLWQCTHMACEDPCRMKPQVNCAFEEQEEGCVWTKEPTDKDGCVTGCAQCVLPPDKQCEAGWSGPGTGDNWCNQCSCVKKSFGNILQCTKQACATPKPTPEPVDGGAACCSADTKPTELECGRSGCHCCADKSDHASWKVGNSGPNVDTDAFCNRIHLKASTPCSDASDGTAATAAPTASPACVDGESGPGTGDNWCNTCTCFKGTMSACTEMACATAPQQCKPGERKQADCNTCSCIEDGLWQCTEMDCEDSTGSDAEIAKLNADLVAAEAALARMQAELAAARAQGATDAEILLAQSKVNAAADVVAAASSAVQQQPGAGDDQQPVKAANGGVVVGVLVALLVLVLAVVGVLLMKRNERQSQNPIGAMATAAATDINNNPTYEQAHTIEQAGGLYAIPMEAVPGVENPMYASMA